MSIKIKYKVDRKKFMEYYILNIARMVQLDVVTDDLIKGSEFVLTEMDILNSVGLVDSKVLHNYTGKALLVPASKCEFIYIQPDE